MKVRSPGVLAFPTTARVRPCDRFVPGKEARFCVCGYGVHAHSAAARKPQHWCSQCGETTEVSVSHCIDHRKDNGK